MKKTRFLVAGLLSLAVTAGMYTQVLASEASVIDRDHVSLSMMNGSQEEAAPAEQEEAANAGQKEASNAEQAEEEGPVPQDKAAGGFEKVNRETASVTGEYCQEQSTYYRNRAIYRQAEETLASGPEDPEKITEAMELFKNCGNVLDAEAQVKECENLLAYLAARSLFNAKKWAEAEEAFGPLATAGYRDSADLRKHSKAHITYNKAEELFKKKKYYDAYLLYKELKGTSYDDLPNMTDKAKACIQTKPKDGEVYHNPKYTNNTTQLTIDNSGHMNTYVKLYIGKDLVSSVFIRADSKATFWLPAGTYKMNKAYGDNWFGTEDLFGDDGYYWTCNFGGKETFTLESGNGYLISSGDTRTGTAINDKKTSRKNL